jgi:subtilase family serine protease
MKLLSVSKLVLLTGTVAAFGQALYAQSARPHLILHGSALPLSSPGNGPATQTPCQYFVSLGLFCPAQLRQAYMTSYIAHSNDGAGMTVYIVDAYDLPQVVQDLAVFSSTTGLPQLDGVGGDGTFTVLKPFGQPPTAVGKDWDYEIALDTQWVHAMAPRANIVLIEALSSSGTDLFNAVQYALTAPGGGKVAVSNSWGGSEFNGETSVDALLAPATMPVLFSTGDFGAPGEYPAVSPFVTAVGGTSLHVNTLGYRSSEPGWSGSGGGVSLYEVTPAFQANNGVNFGARAIPDVALDADPNTGVMIAMVEYGQYIGIGGTSLACPLFAGVLADVDGARAFAGKSPLGSSSGVLNPQLYQLYNSPLYLYDFLDVQSGNNGFAAGKGYDLVTGLGVPSEAALATKLVALP